MIVKTRHTVYIFFQLLLFFSLYTFFSFSLFSRSPIIDRGEEHSTVEPENERQIYIEKKKMNKKLFTFPIFPTFVLNTERFFPIFDSE